MKTYTKEEARQLILEGTHQIHNDCENLEFLMSISNKLRVIDWDWDYFGYDDVSNNPFKFLKIIKLSQIIDEETKTETKKMTFKYRDLQYRKSSGEWVDFHSEVSGEFRFKPDYSKEIESLNKKAAEYGEKVIVKFESI